MTMANLKFPPHVSMADFLAVFGYVVMMDFENSLKKKSIAIDSFGQNFSITLMYWYCKSFIAEATTIYMDVSKNRDTSKWMVYNGKPY